MYRVTLVCKGLNHSVGSKVSNYILEELKEHRNWHINPQCKWLNNILKFTSETDFDDDGQATLDEFGDCLVACVEDYCDSKITIESVEKVGRGI